MTNTLTVDDVIEYCRKRYTEARNAASYARERAISDSDYADRHLMVETIATARANLYMQLAEILESGELPE